MPFPITLRPPVPLTDEELMLFCASNDFMRVELEPNGDLTVMTPAGPGSGHLNSYLTFQIASWAEADGRGEHFDSSSGFRLPDGAMRSLDASWISHERIAALKPGERRGFWRICPEFIVETGLRQRSPQRGRREDANVDRQWCAARLAHRSLQRRGDRLSPERKTSKADAT